MIIQIQWWWSRSSDDPDPTVMIQIEWGSRSSDDDLDQVTMIQIQMNMTWRWIWQELNDDPDDTEKKTFADKLCRENTFLVKRECWCNCNFRMYSLVFLFYCNPMFISGCILMYLSHVIPQCLFQEVSIMRKSCQVIVGLKSPQLWGPRVIRLS